MIEFVAIGLLVLIGIPTAAVLWTLAIHDIKYFWRNK